MDITDDDWQLEATSIAHKQELLAFAQAHGVPVAPAIYGFATNDDLFLSYWNGTTGIGVLSSRLRPQRPTTMISDAQFRALCIAFSQSHSR